eukprot:TRINITY_DN3241_c0_g1_i6.p1 TRINITY_DN3241_c0_g1~~TRINITY_DN3241_c0_g1_i6.p1  ORF type:complete len:149 (-),score=32.05 TRINITY_DN3241_c0_g1_i6:332-778(-)
MLNITYHIFGSSSKPLKLISSWTLVVFYIYLTNLVVLNVLHNIKILRMQIIPFQYLAMQEIANETKKKIKMFVLYGIIIVFYYSFFAMNIGVPLIFDIAKENEAYLDKAEKVVCMVALAFITSIFHPTFFTGTFQLGQTSPAVLWHKA